MNERLKERLKPIAYVITLPFSIIMIISQIGIILIFKIKNRRNNK